MVGLPVRASNPGVLPPDDPTSMPSSDPLRLGAAALLCIALLGCGDDDPTSLEELPDDLMVTWFATSLRVAGVELMEGGMRLDVTFASDGSYRFAATRDRTGFICEPGVWDCVVNGSFAASGTEVVFDPGPDEASLDATLTPTSLRLSGAADGQLVDLSFVLPPYPELIGTWMATALLDSSGVIEEAESPTTLAITFEADGTYEYGSSFSPPDLFCDPRVSCVGEGTYSADAQLAEVHLDRGTRDALTMQIAVTEEQLTLLGFVDGGLQDWAFEKLDVPSPGLEGDWWAVALEFDGLDRVLDGASHELHFRGPLYSSNTISDPPGPFLCEDETAPECSSGGRFLGDLNTVEFLDGLATGPQSVSIEATPTSLRLWGTIDGTPADFLYARVPAFEAP